MKLLKEFKDIHKDSDIYILASGKSIDFIDNSYFKNKIVIGINQAYKKIPCQYLVRKESFYAKTILEENSDSVVFISRGDCGNIDNISLTKTTNCLKNILKNIDNKNIVVYNHNQNEHSKYPSVNIIKDLHDNDSLYVSYSTITTGIHLAVYMGAKNIILIGHDCGTLNGECNFANYHNKETFSHVGWKNEKDYINWLLKIENTTIQLKKILKTVYDCNVYSLNPFINFNLEGNIYKKN